MIEQIVSTCEPITLVGAGRVYPGDLDAALALAPRLVAADGGAATLLAEGHVPEAVIGDFDSLDHMLRAQIPTDALHHVAEQDSTDFEKALMRITAPLVIGVGFTGARIDHELAGLHALLRFAKTRCVLLSEEEVIFLCPECIDLNLTAGTRVSLFPLVPVMGRSEGLEWPIEGLDFVPGGRIGTSNRATGGRVLISVSGPGMLVLLPRETLSEVTQALLAPSLARAL